MKAQGKRKLEDFQFVSFDPIILLTAGIDPQNLLETMSKTDRDWSKAPLADRDQALGALYEWLYGDKIESRVQCQGCKQYYQIDFHMTALREAVMGERDAAPVAYDLPNVDMLRRANDDEACLLRLMFEGKGATAPEHVDADFWAKVEMQNPILDLDIDSTCPNCEEINWTRYSHVHFFSKRLQMTQAMLLDEIHLVASNYHWSKDEICRLGTDVRAGLVARIRSSHARHREMRLEAVQ